MTEPRNALTSANAGWKDSYQALGMSHQMVFYYGAVEQEQTENILVSFRKFPPPAEGEF